MKGIFPRPVTPDEFERLMVFVRLSFAQDGESTERAVLLAVRAALVSPHFLFRVELDRGPAGAGASPLTDSELASRLSYFLWSSMPDDDLMQAAEAGKLRDPDDLGVQVRRVLKTPKAAALTENFDGQWLELQALKQVKPDPARFPEFDEPLRQAMIGETEHFFASVVAEDRGVFDLLDAAIHTCTRRWPGTTASPASPAASSGGWPSTRPAAAEC